MVLGKLIRHVQKKMILHHFILSIKFNSRWIQDLSMWPESVKLLEGNIRRNPTTLVWAMVSWVGSQKHKATKAKTKKSD
jgi:hypothetical protein